MTTNQGAKLKHPLAGLPQARKWSGPVASFRMGPSGCIYIFASVLIAVPDDCGLGKQTLLGLCKRVGGPLSRTWKNCVRSTSARSDQP